MSKNKFKGWYNIMKQRVTDIITETEIMKWCLNDVIAIKAGTGVGKSYFIKNVLYKYAKANNKKILFLVHRTNCVNQFEEELKRDNKLDVIDIKTYQSLEYQKNKFGNSFDFNEYSYVVCDEFQYFISDASFSKTTDISLNMILAQKSVVKIFMSATGDYVKNYMNNIKKIETINYDLPIDFKFIEQLTFFNKEESLDEFIQQIIKDDKKAIFFIQSAKLAYELSQKYKEHCLFNCSKNNGDYYKKVDKDKIELMLKEEKFHEKILITTTCMDAGVNIIDLDLKYIVCDVKDIGTLIQCIGRKRCQSDEDRICLYIKTINNIQLGGMISQLKVKKAMADFLRKHTVQEYILEYPRRNDYTNIVYDRVISDENKCTKEINELMYFKCLTDICDYESMITYGKYGYCKYLANLFGFINDGWYYDYSVVEEDYKVEVLNDYLESIVGKQLFKDEQNELIEKIDVRVNGSRQRSYKKLNDGLIMIKAPYIILPKRTSETRYWVIEKIDI